MKKICSLLLLAGYLVPALGQVGQTSVLFPIQSMFGGAAYGKTITVTAVNTIVQDGYNLNAGTYWNIPSTGTNPIVPLYPNSYLLTIQGVANSVRFSVPASTNVLNLVTNGLITSGSVIYLSTNSFVNINPTNGVYFITNTDGSISIGSSGGTANALTNGAAASFSSITAAGAAMNINVNAGTITAGGSTLNPSGFIGIASSVGVGGYSDVAGTLPLSTNILTKVSAAATYLPTNGNGSGLTGLTAAQIGGLNTNFAVTSNYLNPFPLALLGTIATNSYLISNCSYDTNYNGVYTYAFNTNAALTGSIYTNTLGRCLQFLTLSGTYYGVNIAASPLAGGALFPYLPKDNNQAHVNTTNIVQAVWFASGNVQIYGMQCVPLASVATSSSTVTGNLYGTNYGTSDIDTLLSTRFGTPLPPVDKQWNALGAPVPQITLGEWPSLFTENATTNNFLFCKSNGVIIDSLSLDINMLAVTNGTLCLYPVGASPWGSVSFPSGIPSLINFLHTNGYKVLFPMERYDVAAAGGYSTNTYPNIYNYTPVAQIDTQIKQFYAWGADGVNVDHFYNHPNQTLLNQIELPFAQAIYRSVQALSYPTNATANNNNYAFYRPFSVFYWGLEKADFMMQTANEYDIGDLYLNSNGTGQQSGLAAEQNYEQAVAVFTNLQYWVSPGHTIYAGDIDNQVGAVDLTNAFNLHCILAATVGVTLQGGALTNGQAILAALTNQDLVYNVLKDPLVKMGLPVTNLLSVSGTNVELWARQLSQPYQYAFLIWNHSGTATNVTFPTTAINPALNGTVIIHDPWQQANISTNTGTLSYTIPEFGTRLLVANGNTLSPTFNTLTVNGAQTNNGSLQVTGSVTAASFTGNGSGLTNVKAGGTNLLVTTTASNNVSAFVAIYSQPLTNLVDGAVYTLKFYSVSNIAGSVQCFLGVSGDSSQTSEQDLNPTANRWSYGKFMYATNQTAQLIIRANSGGWNGIISNLTLYRVE